MLLLLLMCCCHYAACVDVVLETLPPLHNLSTREHLQVYFLNLKWPTLYIFEVTIKQTNLSECLFMLCSLCVGLCIIIFSNINVSIGLKNPVSVRFNIYVETNIHCLKVTSKSSLLGRETICLFVPLTGSHCSLITQRDH